MGTWINDDGLRITYGVDEARKTEAGEISTASIWHETHVDLTLTDLSTSANYFPSYTAVIPEGAIISEVLLEVETAATTGSTSTLDVGLIELDNETAHDDDGILAAVDSAVMDEKVIRRYVEDGSDEIPTSATGGGALLGTVLTKPGRIVCSANTAVFTAGQVHLTIRWRIPLTVQS